MCQSHTFQGRLPTNDGNTAGLPTPTSSWGMQGSSDSQLWSEDSLVDLLNFPWTAELFPLSSSLGVRLNHNLMALAVIRSLQLPPYFPSPSKILAHFITVRHLLLEGPRLTQVVTLRFLWAFSHGCKKASRAPAISGTSNAKRRGEGRRAITSNPSVRSAECFLESPHISWHPVKSTGIAFLGHLNYNMKHSRKKSMRARVLRAVYR